MKKVLLPVCAMLLCMTACNKDDEGILRLEIERYTSDAKVHLDGDNYAVWDNNDPVWVNGNDYEVSVSSTTAAISGVPASTEGYKAIYPASWANNAGTTVTYPETQSYRTNGTEQVIDAPMAALSDGGTLKFHNLGSIIAVNVSGVSKVEKIEVIADGTTPINGTCTLNVTTGSPVLGVPTSGGTTTTTLVCNGESVPSAGKTFYIALPPVSAKLTIKVYDGVFIYTRTQGSSMSFASNHGYNVPFDASTATSEQYAPEPCQIWYTAGGPISNFANVGTLVSNEWDNTLNCYVATYSSEITSIPDDCFKSDFYLNSISLPASVTTIGDEAFHYCYSLTSVYMPNVATIGEDAFSSCPKLASVYMPNVATIGLQAFKGCSLTSVDMPNVATIGEQAFFNCSNLTSVDMPNVATIEVSAFHDCDNLASVYMPNVATIRGFAFSRCSSLTSVDMPNVATIEGCAFEYCSGLTSVYMPNVATIGMTAFSECSSLASVHVSGVLTTVEMRAFYNCNITNLYFNSSNPPADITKSSFNITSTGGKTLHVPAGTASNWSSWWDGTIVADL